MGLSCRVVLSEPLSNQKESLPCPVRFEKMEVSIGVISSATMIKSLVGMLSGLEALCGFRFISSLMTPGVEMMIGSMDGMLLWPISGTSLV